MGQTTIGNGLWSAIKAALNANFTELYATGGVKKINIANSEKIMVIGNSYTETGFTFKSKNYQGILSMLSDYQVRTYGADGNDTYEILTLLRANTRKYTTTYPVSLNCTYALIVLYDNNLKLLDVDLDTYYYNNKMLIEAVMSLGMKPILCTEFFHSQLDGYNVADTTTNAYLYLKRLADEYGIDFIDISQVTKKFHMDKYDNYWSGYHPATRTNSILWYEINKRLNLPKPVQSVKIYRKRSGVTVTTLADLEFSTIKDKVKKFIEITNGGRFITAATYDKFDTVPSCSVENVTDEYDLIANGTAVAFGTHTLVEFTLPSAGADITRLELSLTCSATPLVYIRQHRTKTLPTQWDGSDISAAYIAGYKNPQMDWNNITPTDGLYVITTVVDKIQYDKISFLLVHATGFNMTDIYINCYGSKQKINWKPRRFRDLTGTELLSNTLFDQTNDFGAGKWVKTGTVNALTTSDGIVPYGITDGDLIAVDDDNYVSQDITFSKTTDMATQIRIKVWARYNPTRFTGSLEDFNAGSSVIGVDTYDFADLYIGIQNAEDATAFYTEKIVPLNWVEIVVDTFLPTFSDDGQTLVIKSCDTKLIEIAKVSVMDITDFQ